MANYELNVQLNNNAPVVVNFAKLKMELTAELLNYKEKVYTEDNIGAAKEDRAKLNKFKTLLDNERKTRKKEYMQPFEAFEGQIKELCSIVDEVTSGISVQLEAFDEKRIANRKEEINTLFDEIRSNYDLPFVTLDKIFNSKWLNKTVSDKAIATEITAIMEKVISDLEVIKHLPYAYEAENLYRESLNLNDAINKAETFSKIAEMKKQSVAESVKESSEKEQEYEVAFKCRMTRTQAIALSEFCKANGIKLIKV